MEFPEMWRCGIRRGWNFSGFRAIQDFLGITEFSRLFFFRVISEVMCLVPKIPHHHSPQNSNTWAGSRLGFVGQLWNVGTAPKSNSKIISLHSLTAAPFLEGFQSFSHFPQKPMWNPVLGFSPQGYQTLGTLNQEFPWNAQIQGFLGFDLVWAAPKAWDLSGFSQGPFSQCPTHSYGMWMDLPPTLPFEGTSSCVHDFLRNCSLLNEPKLIPTRNPNYFSGE